MSSLVLDTNIVLDLFVFDDARSRPLRAALEHPNCQWLATPAMRDELEHVLAYPHIAGKLVHYGLEAAAVVQSFDQRVRIVEVAEKAPVTCKDADDQKFIDLAVAHRCTLLSKDAAVLSMKKRLAALDVTASSVLPQGFIAPQTDRREPLASTA